ncbi:MAG: ribonuclease HI family protein [Candidatus Omnitrophota bacterium]
MRKDLFWDLNTDGESLSLYVDGASRGNPGPAGIGVVLCDRSQRTVCECGKFIGETTNNVAEYTALIYGLQEALLRKVSRISVHTDSELLARQLQGRYKVKESHLKMLHRQVRALIQNFSRFEIHHVPRTENRRADKLANEAIDTMKL